jgi:hypothetical protein
MLSKGGKGRFEGRWEDGPLFMEALKGLGRVQRQVNGGLLRYLLLKDAGPSSDR